MRLEDGKEYCKLVSKDKHEFIVDKDIAKACSEHIKRMLESKFSEANTNVMQFPEIQGSTLDQVVWYMHYKHNYSNSNERIPDFEIKPELALELLIAAKYLEC